MKRLRTLLFMIFLFCCLLFPASSLQANAAPANSQPRILFIGNSFTSYNKLPTLFKGLCEAAGYSPYTASRTKGGYLLKYHADPSDTVGAKVYKQLTTASWDYVILQDQRYTPMTAPETSFFPACRTLNGLIQNAGADTVFYMTWGYHTSKAFTINGISTTLTMAEIQERLANSYYTIGNELNALVSPVGISFMRCLDQYPEIELWQADGYHPSLAGSYLAACTLFATIFEQSPLNNSYYGGLDAETAQKLQRIADRRLILNHSNVRVNLGNSVELAAQILSSPWDETVETETVESETETVESETVEAENEISESETETLDLDTVTWTSSDPYVASIDPDTGIVTAHTHGMVLITATTPDGLVNKCNVYSEIFAQTLTLEHTNIQLTVGATFPLNYSYTPADATDTYTVSSSDVSVCALNTSGNILAISPGTATITVTGSNGISAKCQVTVTLAAPEGTNAVRSTKKTANPKLTHIKLTWKPVAYAKKYAIYGSTTKNGSYKKIGFTKKTSYVDKKRKVGKNYFYKIKACAANGSYDSAFGQTVRIRVPAAPKLTVLRKGKKQASLSWKKVKYASGYEIYRSKKKNGTYTLVKTIAKRKRTRFTDTRLKQNKCFYYKMRAYVVINGQKIYSRYSEVVECR